VLAAVAVAARAIDLPGAAAGFLLAVAVWAGLGAPGFLLFSAFVVAGTAVTRLGFRRKAAAGLAEARGGRRGAGNALANGGVAAVAAVLAAVTPHREACALAFAGALAAALADTAASELGQLWGRRTVLVTTLRPVAAGTDGGVSWPGTLAATAAALAMAGLSWGLDLAAGGGAAAAVAAGGLAGSLADSLLGATLERRGLAGNDAVNLAATLAGALTAAGLGG
jgi:uncharacterized protein (TIGR00297 family)